VEEFAMRIFALVTALGIAALTFSSCSGGAGGGTGGVGGFGGVETWQLIGEPVTTGRPSYLSLAHDHDGENPVVAWVENENSRYQVYVKQWNGSRWVQLGGALDAVSSVIPRYAEVDTNEQREPVVAFTREASEIFVRRWDDAKQAWAPTDGPGSEPTNGRGPALVMDGDIAWVSMEYDGDLVVRSWTESGGWENEGESLDVLESAAGESAIALPPPNAPAELPSGPVVAFAQQDGPLPSDVKVYVKRWEGEPNPSWAQLGPTGFPEPEGPLSTRAGPDSVTIDASGKVFVAWTDYLAPIQNAFVMGWSDGDPFWRQQGRALGLVEEGAWDPSIEVRDANPYVAYNTQDAAACQPEVVVKRWDGEDWQQVGGALNDAGCECAVPECELVDLVSLALDRSGSPVVAWRGRDANALNVPDVGSIYVKALDP